MYYHPSVSSRARGDSWGAANLDLRAIFLGGLRSLAGGKPDACNQEPFFDFVLHRVTLLHLDCVGFRAASGGWNLAFVLSLY